MQAKPGTLNQVFGLISGGDLGSGRLQELQLQARFQASVQGVLGTRPAPALAGAQCLGAHSSLGESHLKRAFGKLSGTCSTRSLGRGWGPKGSLWHEPSWGINQSPHPTAATPQSLPSPGPHHPSPQTAGPLAGLPVPNCTFPAETQV